MCVCVYIFIHVTMIQSEWMQLPHHRLLDSNGLNRRPTVVFPCLWIWICRTLTPHGDLRELGQPRPLKRKFIFYLFIYYYTSISINSTLYYMFCTDL